MARQIQKTNSVKDTRLDRPRFDAKQFADGVAADHLETGLAQHRNHLRLAEKVDRAALDILQPHFADRHAPGPEAGPCGKEGAAGEFADQPQALRRLLNVVPESDRDGDVVDFVGFPVQNIAQVEVALIRDFFLICKLAAQAEHFGRNIDSGNVRGSTLGEFHHEPARTAPDVADGSTTNVAAAFHYPIETLIDVLAEPLVQGPGDRSFLAGVNGVEVAGDLIPVACHLRHVVFFHADLRIWDGAEEASVVSIHPLSRKVEKRTVRMSSLKRSAVLLKLV